MHLFELFDDPNSLTHSLRQAALDMLTPMAAHKVPFVTVQQVGEELARQHSGLVINRGLIIDILNPDEVKIIKKIEGDRIYLSIPAEDEHRSTKDDAEKQKEKVSKTAASQAMKDLKI